MKENDRASNTFAMKETDSEMKSSTHPSTHRLQEKSKQQTHGVIMLLLSKTSNQERIKRQT